MSNDGSTSLSIARPNSVVNSNGNGRHHASMLTRTPSYSDELGLLLSQVQSHLHMPDPAPYLLVLGSMIANLVSDNAPVWLMLVGAPSSGKTDLIYFVSTMPKTIPVATFTEAALLSGVGRQGNRIASATGGILKQVGLGGKATLIAKDFTSVLSMHFDKRAAIFAALREIYDGKWVRHLGDGGGQQLSWYGKVGFLGGVTDAIDAHSSVTSALGDRFIYCRLDSSDQEQVSDVVLERDEDEFGIKQEIQYNTKEFIESIADSTPRKWRPLLQIEKERLKAAGIIAAIGRSAIIRHPHSKKVEEVVNPESPARIIGTLNPLYRALCCMGCTPNEAFRVVARSAVDCIPKARARIIKLLDKATDGLEAELMREDKQVDHPPVAIYRALEDMEYLRIVRRISGSGRKGDSVVWGLHESFAKRWDEAHLDN